VICLFLAALANSMRVTFFFCPLVQVRRLAPVGVWDPGYEGRQPVIRLAAIRLAVIALCVTVSSFATAEVLLVGGPMTLADLTDGAMMAVGDKVFTNFTYLATGDMPDSDSINVQGIIDCDGNYGVRFQGGFVDLPGGGASDALITFTASVTPDSNMLIHDAHLSANLDVVGGGVALITETFLPTFPNVDLTIFNNGTTAQLTDWVDFDHPVESLSVQKDILLLAEDDGVVTAFSFVDQTFSQVPEPTMGLLVLFGIAGITCACRR
jgi:hypothetical protein